MAKTKEELKQLKDEFLELNKKLAELSEDELVEITGGDIWETLKKIGEGIHSTTKPVLKNPTPSIPSIKDKQ